MCETSPPLQTSQVQLTQLILSLSKLHEYQRDRGADEFVLFFDALRLVLIVVLTFACCLV